MELQFDKYEDGLIPAIVQDAQTKTVLMLGFMNEEAIRKTKESNQVTFYSRSKKRLWTKGETSDNYLNLVSMEADCDQDALLVTVTPDGPVCHKGTDTCWGKSNEPSFSFLDDLAKVLKERKENPEQEKSYVASIYKKGINAIAQKVGEEAVEVVIEAKDENDLAFLNESADLLFHFMVLLEAKGLGIKDVADTLRARHRASS
ncbi:bifunctional phosphoribosyl-AMP cyclohydrolase/phosphoribosyl-ATP diphosphatase HisIE [Luteirhabdus pelagi]|uniref:bifunctional phosphoribosyl-AMP cyclohydrolase/phosphoribosyl-ATP diphosphatase HisIE n=1 Tax=Luteirhabdus pelagi TaxID=2792783 RepID=UPI0019398BC4|nr:bifunctional phosphoribosyl-AMP cyclohydrolase/phosphoribosyl-ATP diphosphatase HisIE [Luteirhabdus pelagi]